MWVGEFNPSVMEGGGISIWGVWEVFEYGNQKKWTKEIKKLLPKNNFPKIYFKKNYSGRGRWWGEGGMIR